MKIVYVGIILFLYYFSAVGQVTFDQLPQDLQLYPRNANNQAEVVISGKVTDTGYTKIGMLVLREGVVTKGVSQTLAPTGNNTAFKLASFIKAEPADYSFRVFVYKGQDSLLVADRKQIVCGDVYIIYGQSNALGLAQLDDFYSFNFDDKYLRNATYPYQGTPSQMSWYQAKRPFASVGGPGLTIQRLILQTYGIPTCVLNGAQGGTAIDALSSRDPINHANPVTFYGDLLYRAQWAGVAKQVKAIIWRQGEEDAGAGLPGYDAKFAKLYNQFREDYGDARIYVAQINLLANRQEGAAALRDFQRRTKYLFNNVETIATLGTPGYDGVHYDGLAYQRFGFEQFRQIARDFYGATDTLQINSPDVKKVFYNARKDSITLAFDDQQQMVWKSDTSFYNFATGEKVATREQKDYFYLDGQTGFVTGGLAAGNRVILSLKQPASAKTIRYLPAYFSDNTSEFYNGPTLRNTRGMRAFSFDGVPIADAIAPVTTLVGKSISEKQIQLTWTASATAQAQILERADGVSAPYKQIAALGGTVATYSDNALPDPLGTYLYRLRAYSPASESTYSNVVRVKPLILGLEPAMPAVQLYPNPLAADRVLHVVADRVTFVELTMRDVLGRAVKSWQGIARNILTIRLDELEAGMYIADLKMADGQILRRKVIVR